MDISSILRSVGSVKTHKEYVQRFNKGKGSVLRSLKDQKEFRYNHRKHEPQVPNSKALTPSMVNLSICYKVGIMTQILQMIKLGLREVK